MVRFAALLLIGLLATANGIGQSFRAEIKLTQTEVGNNETFLVDTAIRNIGTKEQSLEILPCTYPMQWVADNPHVFVDRVSCLKNSRIAVTLKPNEAYEQRVPVHVELKPHADGHKKVTFRLGYGTKTPMGVWKPWPDIPPIWSNPVTVTVVSGLTAKPSFRAEAMLKQPAANDPRTFLVATAIRNTGEQEEFFYIWDCGYPAMWTTDNPIVQVYPPSCQQNVPEEIELKAGEAYERGVPVHVELAAADAGPKAITFRLEYGAKAEKGDPNVLFPGRGELGTWKPWPDIPPIWSNAVTVTVGYKSTSKPSFKAEVRLPQTEISNGEDIFVDTAIRNTGTEDQLLDISPCIYQMQWVTDSPLVRVDPFACTLSSTITFKLKPGEAYEKEVLVHFVIPRQDTDKVTFRLGYGTQSSKGRPWSAGKPWPDIPPIWSNPVTVGVVNGSTSRAPVKVENEEPGFSVRVASSDAPIKLAGPINATITVTNDTNHDIFWSSDISKETQYTAFRYHLERNGHELETTSFHPYVSGMNRPGDPSGVYAATSILVSHPPGKMFEMTIDLKRLYQITEPGEYSFHVSRYDEVTQTTVSSNTLLLKIEP